MNWNHISRIWKRNKLEEDFDATLSAKIKVTDRVRHRTTKILGTVIQTGVVEGTVRVPAISVQHDNGSTAWLLPAEEYTKATKY